jgi:hypothetical protein
MISVRRLVYYTIIHEGKKAELVDPDYLRTANGLLYMAE